MRGAGRALQGITAEAVARWRLNTRAGLAALHRASRTNYLQNLRTA